MASVRGSWKSACRGESDEPACRGESDEAACRGAGNEPAVRRGASMEAALGAASDGTARGRAGLGTAARLAPAVAVAALALAACAASQPPVAPGEHLPGFWLGLWQGFIAPITFIVSLFGEGLRIYAFPNAGRWYDFGFMLGIGGFTGGAFAGFRRRR